MNGGWPPSSVAQTEAAKPLAPMFENIVTFWKAIADGTAQLPSNGGKHPLLPSGLRSLDHSSQKAQVQAPTFADFNREVSSCMFDALLAMQYLGQAGVAITQGVRDCDHGKDGVSACTTDVSNAVASFGFVATFLSAMMNECPIRDNMGFAQRGIGELYKTTRRTMCAEQSSRLVASLASISAGAAGISEMCMPGKARSNRGLPPAGGRRLDSVGFVKDRKLDVASCVFDTVGATFYLARAGVVIDEAAQLCGERFGSPAKCASSVSAVVEAFGYVGMFLANSVAQCAREAGLPLDEAFEATCAADISQVVAGLSGIAESGSAMAVSCGDDETVPFNQKFGHHGLRHLTTSSLTAELNASNVAFHDLANGDRRKLRAWVEKHAGPADDSD